MYLGYYAGQVPEIDLDAFPKGQPDISAQNGFSLQDNVLLYQNPAYDEVTSPALEILATGVVALLENPPVRRPPLAERSRFVANPSSKRRSSWWRW